MDQPTTKHRYNINNYKFCYNCRFWQGDDHVQSAYCEIHKRESSAHALCKFHEWPEKAYEEVPE